MAKRCPTLSRYVILSVPVLNPSTILLIRLSRATHLRLGFNPLLCPEKSYPNSVITTFCNITSPGFSVESPIVAVPKGKWVVAVHPRTINVVHIMCSSWMIVQKLLFDMPAAGSYIIDRKEG